MDWTPKTERYSILHVALDLLFLLIRREAINIGIRNFDYEFCSYAITEVLRLQNGAYF